MKKLAMATGVVLAVLEGAGLPATPASADEAKTPISAVLLITNVLTRPVEQRQVAFDESLKRDGPPPRGIVGEVLPDGSVRYGSVTVTVKNPCPPGTDHYEPPPLPGRRARK